MKRKIIFVFLMVFFVLSAPLAVYAEETAEFDEEVYNDVLSSYNLDVFEEELDDNTYSLLEELGISGFSYESLTGLRFEDALSVIQKMAQEKVKSPLLSIMTVLIYIVLSSLFQSLKTDGDAMSETFSTVSALIISVVLVIKISSAVTLAASAIGLAADFIYAFIPVFATIVIASGGITTAFSTNSMLLMLSQGLSALSANVFMPMVNSFLAVGICSSLKSDLRLDGVVGSMKKVITTLISFTAGAFVSVLSLKTTISARADILGIRSVRFVINSVVPVVGGAISEGLLSIETYSSLIKSSVGIVGIAAVALVFLPSIIETVMWRMVLWLGGLICGIFNDRSVSLVLKSFSEAMLLINVVLVVSMLTTIVSIGILIAAGG